MMAHKSHKRIEKPTAHTHSLPLRTAAYLRISGPNPKQSAESMEYQLIIIEEFLSRRPDLALVATYTDITASSCDFQHERFQQLIEAIEDNRIDCVIVKDLSHLGQYRIEIGYYVESYFPRHGIRLISIADHLETADGVSNLSKQNTTNSCPSTKNIKMNCIQCSIPAGIPGFYTPELTATHISEIISLCDKPPFDDYANQLRDQLVLLQHKVSEVDLQIERQKFLVESLGPNVQKGIITPPESEELRLTFESRQTELAKVRNQLLEKIQWIRDTTTSF